MSGSEPVDAEEEADVARCSLSQFFAVSGVYPRFLPKNTYICGISDKYHGKNHNHIPYRRDSAGAPHGIRQQQELYGDRSAAIQNG